ncbi:thioredoxin [Streptococcus iniae]|uniref:conjugal transfer protein TraF n=1 Tax=Streptococcus iniae TaxID=1346 RepID=UPI0008DB24AA|nr:conjugal transfer protein TraF [Streptococcus iniae]OHX27891.1 thiol reductase thioredoxin [Streptococcus iniae]RLV28444.1 thioredoxin [Streptococcus iniae]
MSIEAIFQAFTPVNMDQMEALLQKEELILFVGRLSCPYCRKFAPKLQQASLSQKKEVYFLDSEDLAYFDDIQAFRHQFGMTTVPALLVKHQGSLDLVCDSSMTLSEIEKRLAI